MQWIDQPTLLTDCVRSGNDEALIYFATTTGVVHYYPINLISKVTMTPNDTELPDANTTNPDH